MGGGAVILPWNGVRRMTAPPPFPGAISTGGTDCPVFGNFRGSLLPLWSRKDLKWKKQHFFSHVSPTPRNNSNNF
jgi:hypothetical protein